MKSGFSVPVPAANRARSLRERDEIRAQARGLGWPYEPQQLLLKVLTSDTEPAKAAWAAWKEKYEVDTADTGSTRLFPLVVRRLAAAGVVDPDFPRLHGFARHTWASNQERVRAGLEAVRTLVAARVPVLALKGLSLLFLYFARDLSSRPMYNVDLLIPHARLPEAHAALTAAGWSNPATRETANDYRRGALGAVDLHWHVLHQYPSSVFDRLAWKHARCLPGEGPGLLALGPTELLIHICLHGVRAETRRRRAWPLDVVRILEISGPEVDWTRLVDFASAHNMTLALEDALRYVTTLTDAVPEEALARLAEANTSLLELEEYRVITSGRGLYARNRDWTGRPIYSRRRKSLIQMRNLRHEGDQEPPQRPDFSRALRGFHQWRSSRKP